MSFTVLGDLNVGRNLTVASTVNLQTPTAGDNSTNLATTAFVTSAISNKIGSGSGGATFTASGAITAGAPVALNSDGTVSQVVQLTYSTTPGSPVVFNSAVKMYYYNDSLYIGNSQVLLAYSDNNQLGYLILGTVSGSSINWQSPVLFSTLSGINSLGLVYTGSQIVILYNDMSNSQSGTAIICSVSGTTLTLGSPVIFNQGTTQFVTGCWDTADSKLVVAYKDANTGYGYAKVGTISGTGNAATLSFGSAVVFSSSSSATTYGVDICWDSTDSKAIIAYCGNSGYVTVGTVSGTSISFGSPVIFNSSATNAAYISYTTGSSIVVFYNQGNTTTYLVAGTVSGNSVSFGTAISIVSYASQASLTWNNSAIIVSYIQATGNQYSYSVAATISGNTLTKGTTVQFLSSPLSSGLITSCWDSTDSKLIIASIQDVSSFIAYTAVATVSGTTITYGNNLAIKSTGSIGCVSSCYDSVDSKVVIAYSDSGNSNYGTVIVGTVSGTSISFGAPVVFSNAATGNGWQSINVISTLSSTIAITYSSTNNSYSGMCIIGTVSGNSVSFGTAVVYANSTTYGSVNFSPLVYDSIDNKIIIAYGSSGGTGYTQAIVGTISGSSVSFGTSVAIISGPSNFGCITYIGTSQVIVSYSNVNSPNQGYSAVGTISGMSISFGTAVVFNSSLSYWISTVWDSVDSKVIISYSNNNNYGIAVVGTVSGTSISFGAAVTFNSANTQYLSSTYDPYDNQVCIYYQTSNNSGNAVIGSVSGTSISFTDTFSVAGTTNISYSSVCYDSTDKQFVFSYNDTSNTRGAVVVAPNLGGIGAPVIVSSSQTAGQYLSICYDPIDNKVVVTYVQHSNSYYYVMVGTVVGSNITFGTPVLVATGVGTDYYSSTVYVGGSSVVLAYGNSASPSVGYAVAGTISGSSITLGSAVSYSSGARAINSTACYIGNNTIVISYIGTSNYGYAVVGTVSGTSLSFGTPVQFYNNTTSFVSMCWDPVDAKILIAYQNISNYCLVILGTVSGNSISFTGNTACYSATCSYISICYTTNSTVVVAYQDNTYYGQAVVGTVSGNSVSFGASTYFVGTALAAYISICYDPVDAKVIIVSSYKSAYYGAVVVGTISGTTITFNSPTIVNSQNTQLISTCWDSVSSQLLFIYFQYSSPYYAYVQLYTVSSSNAANLIGVSTQSVGNGASVPVTLYDGVNSNQSGLTPGATYYVSNSGAVSTTQSSYVLGKAISSTSLLVKCGM